MKCVLSSLLPIFHIRLHCKDKEIIFQTKIQRNPNELKIYNSPKWFFKSRCGSQKLLHGYASTVDDIINRDPIVGGSHERQRKVLLCHVPTHTLCRDTQKHTVRLGTPWYILSNYFLFVWRLSGCIVRNKLTDTFPMPKVILRNAVLVRKGKTWH